jgi:uncharacterized phage-associated protein
MLETQNQGQPPSTVAEVANEFLALAANEGIGASIDQMKLQKLLFYSHAWHLAYDHGPLFENDFEAWPWGPVVRDVYVQTKTCGRGPVSVLLSDFRAGADGYSVSTPEGVNENLKPFIRGVWDSLKAYSGIQLSNSTHGVGEPWTIVAEQLGTADKPIIPNGLITDIFKKKLEAYAQANPAA